MPLFDLSHTVEDGMITRLRGLELSGRPVHSLLLREEVPMVEHLTGLDALPIKVKAFGTFPVRAFAET